MNNNEYLIVLELRNQIAKLVNQYNKLEKMPFDTGLGDFLYPSELNMIEAIQSGKGKTVTELCEHFGITKGAVSQTISKLIKRGYVSKERSIHNRKEVLIELTEKGKTAFDRHEEFHRQMDESMTQLLQGIQKEKSTISSRCWI